MAPNVTTSPMSLAERVVSSIDANRTVKDELTAALARQGRRRRISVTDLVNLRQAFFQRARPDIQPDPERKQPMLAGTGFHELFGRPGALKGFDVRFKDLTAVEREMVRRRDLFREALASQDPSRLPRCEWFELRCDYRAV